MEKEINYKLMFDDGNASFEIAGFADRESAEQKRETIAFETQEYSYEELKVVEV